MHILYIILILGLGQHPIIKHIICSVRVWIFMRGRINSKVSIVFFWYSNKLMDEIVWYSLNTWDSLLLWKILNKTSNQAMLLNICISKYFFYLVSWGFWTKGFICIAITVTKDHSWEFNDAPGKRFFNDETTTVDDLKKGVLLG